jgi:hypothetical protein
MPAPGDALRREPSRTSRQGRAETGIRMKYLLLALLLVLIVAGMTWLARPLWALPPLVAPLATPTLALPKPGAPTPSAGQASALISPRTANEEPLAPSGGPAISRNVTAIGDSVMLAAASDLQAAIPNIAIDAVVGRQVPAALEILRERRAAGTLGSVVIIHMGTNGSFTSAQFDEMMRLLSGVGRVLFVDVKCPTSWEAADNLMLQEAAKRYPGVVLVSWYAASANRPELFWDDGIHLRPEGARVYAALVAAAVNGR